MISGKTKDNPVADGAPRRSRPAWFQTLIAVPGAVLPLLPSFSCPVCVAAYAGLLSSLGLGFLLTHRVQRPLIVVFLTITFASATWAAKQHKRLGPLIVTLVGSLGIVAGGLVWNIRGALYLGVGFLAVGAVWNLVLKRPRHRFVQVSPGTQ